MWIALRRLTEQSEQDSLENVCRIASFKATINTRNVVNNTVGPKTTLLCAQWNIQLWDESDFIFFASNTKRFQKPPPPPAYTTSGSIILTGRTLQQVTQCCCISNATPTWFKSKASSHSTTGNFKLRTLYVMVESSTGHLTMNTLSDYIRKLIWFKTRRWRFLIYVGQTGCIYTTRYTNRYISKVDEYVSL